jgi:hypothetical protein
MYKLFIFAYFLLLYFVNYFAFFLFFCFFISAPLRLEVLLQEERIRRLRYQIEEMTRWSKCNKENLTCD